VLAPANQDGAVPAFLVQYHLVPIVLEVIRLYMWLVILAALFVPLERLFALHPREVFSREFAGDHCFYVISSLVPNLLMAIPLSIVAYAAYHFVPWRLHAAIAAWPLWLRGLAAFVVGDLGFYWGHRWAHEIPFLWRFHAIHHDPKEVYFLISARAHPVDFVFIHLCGLIPVYVLGLGAPQSVQGTMVATVIMLIVTVWGFFIHANIRWRLGPLEWLISTPAFHHWHHTLSDHRDHNYASMLPWVDRLFGTYYLPRKAWPEAYGTDATLPRSVVGQLVYPLYAPAAEVRLPEPIVADR
jgi:sterol desaturase/sphingolipid hydroxylase (fatty acid hydroxylase superfamily)